MNKVTVTFLHKERNHTFEFRTFADALDCYYDQCKGMGDHAGLVEGEWIVSLLTEKNEIYKQLKLTSTRNS